MVGATMGDVMKLQIKVNDKGIIEDIWNLKLMDVRVNICSSSLLTEWVRGKTVDQAQEN